MRKVNVGIASFAHMHAFKYLEVFQELSWVNVTGFCDMLPERRKSVQASHNIPSFASYGDLCHSNNVDIVLITTETIDHLPVALAAFENGKDVIVEKPIATNLDDAKILIKSAEKHDCRVFQCYPCRYHPSVRRVKQLMHEGELGEITGIASTNHGKMPSPSDPATAWFSSKEKAGGGAIMDHTTHVADLIFHFTGWIPRSVFGVARRLFHDDINVDDAGMILVKYNNGVAASIDPSWNRPSSFPIWGDLTLCIYTTRQTVQLDLFNQNLRVYSTHGDEPVQYSAYGPDIERFMLVDYLECFMEGRSPPVTAIDGFDALKVAIKAYESSEKGDVVPWITSESF